MLTGVELAGIILAVLPIVKDGIEKSENGLSAMQDWWRYRTVFKKFQHDVDLQTLLLRQQLEHLLQQIVLSPSEMSTLIQNPGGPAWSSKDLDTRLRKILPGDSYDCYMQTVQYASELLQKLKTKLVAADQSVRIRAPMAMNVGKAYAYTDSCRHGRSCSTSTRQHSTINTMVEETG
jgi:hypothetical protein